MTGFRARDGSFTLEYLQLILSNPVLLRGLLNSTIVAVLTTALTLVIALPLAILSVRFDFPGRGMMSGLLLVPMILPPFVGAVGMRVVLARYGPLTQLVGAGDGIGIDWLGSLRLFGVVVVEALGLYPIMLLNASRAGQRRPRDGTGRRQPRREPGTIFGDHAAARAPGLFAGARSCSSGASPSWARADVSVYDVTPVQGSRRSRSWTPSRTRWSS